MMRSMMPPFVLLIPHAQQYKSRYFRCAIGASVSWATLSRGLALRPCLTFSPRMIHSVIVLHLRKWAPRVVERWVLRATPGQPKGGKKHHDTISDMIAASSHVLSSVSRGGTQWVYVGRLFVVSARSNKRHHQHLAGHDGVTWKSTKHCIYLLHLSPHASVACSLVV